MFIANYFKELKKNSLIILPDKETAAYFQNDLANLLDNDKTLFFPSSYQRSALYEKTDTSSIVLRTEVLNKIIQKGKSYLIVTYPEALLEKVISKKQLEKQSLEIKVGESLSTDFIIEILNDYEFERVNFVHEPGQFSVRGSIIDIFSFSNEDPYRVDFFGDDIDSIRTFDIENQLSKEKLQKIFIIPNIQDQTINENYISFLDFIPSRTAIWFKDLKFCKEKVNDVYYKTINKYNETEEKEEKQNPEGILINGDALLNDLTNYNVIEFGNKSFLESDKLYNFSISVQPAFSKNFDLLISNLMENQHNGYHNILLSDNNRQIERLDAIFKDKGVDVKFSSVGTALHEGFVDNDLRVCCYTDHQIFERYHKFKLRTKFSNKESEYSCSAPNI
jgi:transcription-repair coupling factor (superfamily II helicase)